MVKMTHHLGHLGQVCSSLPAHSMAGSSSLSPTLGIQSTGNSLSMVLAEMVLALESTDHWAYHTEGIRSLSAAAVQAAKVTSCMLCGPDQADLSQESQREYSQAP